MSTEWIYRYYLVVSAADQADAKAAAVRVTGSEADAASFDIPLSASGSGPATHYASNTLATEAIRSRMLQELAGLGSLQFWRISSPDGELLDSNCVESEERIGSACTFHEALADAGLQKIQPDI